MKKHNYITILEPYICTTNGLRKPDILTYKIISDTVSIIDIHVFLSYYNTPDITDYS